MTVKDIGCEPTPEWARYPGTQEWVREWEHHLRERGGNLIGKHLYFIKNIQGDFGHFRENNQIIVSKVAKIALNIFYKL